MGGEDAYSPIEYCTGEVHSLDIMISDIGKD